MRRHLALTAAVLALAACAKSETPATDSPAAAVAAAPAALTDSAVSGTWEAQGMPMDKDTVVVRFTMNNTDTGAGTSITFASGDKVQNTSRQVSGDSVVSTSGPFKSQVRKGQNVASTRSVMRLQDGKLVGFIHAKYANGDTASFRVTATKRAP
jgi:phosphopentomutase